MNLVVLLLLQGLDLAQLVLGTLHIILYNSPLGLTGLLLSCLFRVRLLVVRGKLRGHLSVVRNRIID